MSKQKKNSIIIETEEDTETEMELDEEIVYQFGDEIQRAIDTVSNKNLTKDVRLELVNVLLSVSAQVALDIEISGPDFLDMAEFFYDDEGQESTLDIPKLN
ncbi:MAG: hypothetical protein Q8P20_09470 [bacterium]|nr:hypothetical protein [bacterium]